MKITVYSAKPYEIPYFEAYQHQHQSQSQFRYIQTALTIQTAREMEPADVISCFVLDDLSEPVLIEIKQKGVRLIALRSAGFDHVDLNAARHLNLLVVRVPSYSPHAIAEFTLGILLNLTRHIAEAHDRVRRHNFSLQGLMGFDLQGKTVGIIGTGQIGTVVAKILCAMECKILALDPSPNDLCKEWGVKYVDLEQLLTQSDVVTLHCPLSPKTQHMINKDSLALMKPKAILINTGRGPLIDTIAVIDALKQGKIGALGIDVYEHERDLFFVDRSEQVIQDEAFLSLQSFPNVLITGHQAFFSKEAVDRIMQTTLDNIHAFANGVLQNQV